MVIAAKYQGICQACGGPVRVGERIHWRRGARFVSHAECPNPAAQPDGEPSRFAERSEGDCPNCKAGIRKGDRFIRDRRGRQAHVECPTPCADGCGAARPKTGPVLKYFNTWERAERLWHPEEQPGVYAFARVEPGAQYPSYPTLADGTVFHLNYGTIAGPCSTPEEAYKGLDSWERKWPGLAGQMRVYRVPCLYSDAPTWVPIPRP